MSRTADKMTQASELAERLLGTCKAPPDDLHEDLELCELLDEQVLLCEECGWWCEAHEVDDGVCEDCRT